jgi:xanthine dehydrogenase YagT iron-sulfur-binding subunit
MILNIEILPTEVTADVPEAGQGDLSGQGPCGEGRPTVDGEHVQELDELERHGLLSELTRRRFLQASSAMAASLALGFPAAIEAQEVAITKSVTLKVNGQPQTLSLDPRTSLLDALREHMDLTGTKKGCDHGQCGACTVLIDGRRVNSCLTLAFAAEGAEITTIEGLARTSDPKAIEDLSTVQAAFLMHDGYQCGYCTPGQIISATAAITEQQKGELSIVSWHSGQSDRPELTDDEIRERMSGNICRCGAYPNIVAAVRAASKGASA